MNASQSTPEIPAVLALAGPLRPLASPNHPLHATACQEIAARAGELLKTAGIPGVLAVTLTDGEVKNGPGPLLSLTINGRLCWPGAEPVVRLLDGIAKNAGGSQVTQRQMLDGLKETCLEMLKDQPDVLLDLPQAAVVAGELERPRRRKGSTPPDWPPDPAALLAALRVPVGLGVSIADRQTAAQVIAANESLWSAPEDLGEVLAGALSARQIILLLPSDLFQGLTLAWQEKGGEDFSQLRLDLARELGLNLPPFSFQSHPELPVDQFAFRFQHIVGLPFSGLNLDNLLEKLAGEIRRLLPRLVVQPRVEAQLALVDDELRAMVQDRLPLPVLTRELRRVARQGSGLRRLPLILEELLDVPFAAAGAPGTLALY